MNALRMNDGIDGSLFQAARTISARPATCQGNAINRRPHVGYGVRTRILVGTHHALSVQHQVVTVWWLRQKRRSRSRRCHLRRLRRPRRACDFTATVLGRESESGELPVEDDEQRVHGVRPDDRRRSRRDPRTVIGVPLGVVLLQEVSTTFTVLAVE